MSPPTSTTSAAPGGPGVPGVPGVPGGLDVPGATGRTSGLPHEAAASALVSKTDREIDLEITGFETIPKIEAQEGQHDLPKVEPRPHADRIFERCQRAVVTERRLEQVGALVVRRAAQRGVARIEEPEGADRQPGDREQRQRVLDVRGD